MKRILIVDDSLELGRLVQTVFLTLDPALSIHVVPSAEEALLESTRKPLDLLVSDIRLPGMSGFDLVKKIRARHPSIKVLFITGLSDPGVAEQARQLNADGFFPKPLDMPSFLETARRCLELPADAPLSQVPAGRVSAGEPVPTAPVLIIPHPETSPALLSDGVAGLRQRLGAQAVFVLDERGRIVAQAGDVPALPLEETWISPVMAALSSVEKVAHLLGDDTPRQVMAFPGKEYQLVLAPAGNYALLILLRPGPSSLRLALAVEEALDVQRPLAEILAGIERKFAPEPALPLEPEPVLPPTSPLAPAPAAEPEAPPEVNEASLVELEALFQKPEETMKEEEMDAFWDSLAASGHPGLTSSPDVLSYDQARKLGLTPKEDKK